MTNGTDQSSPYQAQQNRLEAEAIDRYLEMMPYAWHKRVDIEAKKLLEMGNRVARRYRLRERDDYEARGEGQKRSK